MSIHLDLSVLKDVSSSTSPQVTGRQRGHGRLLSLVEQSVSSILSFDSPRSNISIASDDILLGSTGDLNSIWRYDVSLCSTPRSSSPPRSKSAGRSYVQSSFRGDDSRKRQGIDMRAIHAQYAIRSSPTHRETKSVKSTSFSRMTPEEQKQRIRYLWTFIRKAVFSGNLKAIVRALKRQHLLEQQNIAAALRRPLFGLQNNQKCFSSKTKRALVSNIDNPVKFQLEEAQLLDRLELTHGAVQEAATELRDIPFDAASTPTRSKPHKVVKGITAKVDTGRDPREPQLGQAISPPALRARRRSSTASTNSSIT